MLKRSLRSKQLNGRASKASARDGFTLIETSMATVIIGVGVLAMVDAQSAFIISNQWSSHAASATFLANEIREYTRNLPKHDPVNGLMLVDEDGTMIISGWGVDGGEVTVDDFDDIDDFDGITFSFVGTPGLNDNDLPGPINAFGEVIPALSHDGDELGSTNDQDLFSGEAMFGWYQTVVVEKINPFDTSIALDNSYFELPEGSFPGRNVDEYPLRVSVMVFYQGANDITADLVTTVSWIVP